MSTINATTTSQRLALPPQARIVRIFNGGPSGVWVEFGDAHVIARQTANLIFANTSVTREVSSAFTHWAAVTSHGTAVVDVDRESGDVGIGGAIISDTEPENVPDGTFWYDWSAPQLNLRFDHQTWLQIAPAWEAPPGPPAPPPIPQPPLITSVLEVISQTDAAFHYQITGSGNPTSFGATGLPSWLSVDTTTGLITGTTPSTDGVHSVGISATNQHGTGTATLEITISSVSPTPPWEMTYSFPSSQVTFANDATGRIPVANWTGWDPAFAADLNDQALYLGPNAPTDPSEMVVRLFATFTPPGTEVEVDFDLFGGGTPAPNTITQWGYDSGSNSIYIEGANSTGNPIELRLEKA